MGSELDMKGQTLAVIQRSPHQLGDFVLAAQSLVAVFSQTDVETKPALHEQVLRVRFRCLWAL